MMASVLLFSSLYFILLSLSVRCQFTKPEQIHLSYGVDPSQMIVTWSTQNYSQNAVCYYGAMDNPDAHQKATGTVTKFTDPHGALKHTQYIHRVVLSTLNPDTKYLYYCGNEKSFSDVYEFTSMNPDPTWSPTLALFGDFGSVNAQSLDYLRSDVTRGKLDAILHVGDFAYDLQSNNGFTGDDFLKNIEPIASKVPYMTCPGNHEYYDNFTHYKNRFTMPGDENGDHLFYSFDIGRAHIISLNTEYYYYWQFGAAQVLQQFHWLVKDLDKALANRKERPWIITMGHRPMYCSNFDRDDCRNNNALVRSGIPFVNFFGLEDLFDRYGVDLMFWAHEHSYERLWPIYDTKVYNGSLETPYTNPPAGVHIITGSAGCSEDHDKFTPKYRPEWSAYRTTDYGYTRMKVYNSTHLYMEQVSTPQGGNITDTVWLIKDRHGPYQRRKTVQSPTVDLH